MFFLVLAFLLKGLYILPIHLSYSIKVKYTNSRNFPPKKQIIEKKFKTQPSKQEKYRHHDLRGNPHMGEGKTTG